MSNFLDAAGLARFFAGLGAKFAALSHTHGTADIEDGAITTDKIANMAVTTSKLGNKCVANGNLGDMSVQEGKIFPQAVTTTKIRDGAVTEDKLDEALKAKINAGGGSLSIDEVVGSGLDHYSFTVSGTYILLNPSTDGAVLYSWSCNVDTDETTPDIVITADSNGVTIQTGGGTTTTIQYADMHLEGDVVTAEPSVGFTGVSLVPYGDGARVIVYYGDGDEWTDTAALTTDHVYITKSYIDDGGDGTFTHTIGHNEYSDGVDHTEDLTTPCVMTEVTIQTTTTQTEQLTFIDGTDELTVPYTRHLGEACVDTVNIKDDAVTLDKMANESVDFAQLKKAATSKRIASNRTLALNGTYTVGSSYPFGNYTFLLVVCDYVDGSSYPDATKYAYLIPAPTNTTTATLKGSRFVSDGTIAGFGWYDFELTFAGSTRVVTLTKSKLIQVSTTASPWAVTAEDVKMRISAIYGIR